MEKQIVMKVKDMIEWLKEKDQEADVKVLEIKENYLYEGGEEINWVDFNGDNEIFYNPEKRELELGIY